MGRWLLEALPMWVLGIASVVLPALVTWAVAVVARRRWPSVTGGSYKDTGAALLTQTLAIYGLVLAFVIVNQYAAYSQTKQDVQTEALNIEDVYRVSQSLAAPSKDVIADAVRIYVQSVVRDEFPALAEGKAGPQTAAAFSRLDKVLRNNPPTDPAQLTAYGTALDYLHTAHDARHRRLDAASASLPGILSAFLILGALASVAASLLLGLRSHQLLVPVSLAALLGFTLLLSLSLEHPFSGDGAVSSVHFTQGELAQLFPVR